jgi:Na+/H+ antiporter NhaD/arsenite permease-like protein
VTVVAELAAEAGVFAAVAERLARVARGRAWLLWLLVVALAVVCTAFLSLDTTAVLLTPVVVLLAVHCGLPPLPFAMTTVWLADRTGPVAAHAVRGRTVPRRGGGGANAINNLPAYLALEPIAGSPARIAALLIGVNAGPLITPWASLATLLWHSRLHSLGVDVPWTRYALLGLVVAPLTVVAATTVLALTLG